MARIGADFDLPGLTRALEALAGTQTDEQVFITPVDDWEPWHLDVVELDEGDGPRFAVYVEYGGAAPFEDRDLPLPDGSVIDADEGSSATVTFGELSATAAAESLVGWATTLSAGSPFAWSTTLDDRGETVPFGVSEEP
jgi:hypothetical protein